MNHNIPIIQKITEPFVIFWHRRDLRKNDNCGLTAAASSGLAVLPIFIFDTNILNNLADRDDARITFICDSLKQLQQQYATDGFSLQIFYGKPVEIFSQLQSAPGLHAVFTNEDYEPYARERDAGVATLLRSTGRAFFAVKDQVIFSPEEILKEDGKPYTIFTPFAKKWRERFSTIAIAKPTMIKSNRGDIFPTSQAPEPEMFGFSRNSRINFPPKIIPLKKIREYSATRDRPDLPGTSRLGPHLRFGTISIRQLAQLASATSETFLNELIWREFFMMILWHFPHVARGAFRPEYDRLPWRNHPPDIEKWQTGNTGYPLVDAGMRELNQTGFMHNRVRMITASFLTKHLLVDWRIGEAYFARKLLDFDLAANNGGWQWCASTGCDAAPYFRIFNPTLQQRKFDPQSRYVNLYCPEYQQKAPVPMIDHAFARQRALEFFGAIKNK